MNRTAGRRWSVAALLALAALFPLPGAAHAATPTTTIGADRAVGPLSSSNDITDHGCTASLVASPKGNIAVTAAHCVAGGGSMLFAPGYSAGKAPYGTWQVASVFVWDGWKSSHDINGAGSPYDYAFLVLAPQDGKNAAEVVGATFTLRTDLTLPRDMTVYGHPSDTSAYQDKSYRCDSNAAADGPFWLTLQCLGIPGGFSGGPWLSRGTRDLFGVIGGRGQNLPPTDARNYSVRFDARTRALYDKAVAAPVPNTAPNDNLGYPLGSSALWKHADLIANGYFTGGSTGGARHMDMIVKWSDGEVTLYQGSTSTDPRRPFAGETQLAAPAGIWTHAVTMTSVNVGGGDGLVVRWTDGELTLYSHVDAGGLHGEVQLAAANDLWKHATLITAGQHTANALRDDLIVVWTDGEVSLYGDVASRGLGYETQLAAANDTWKHAVTITSGGYSGRTFSDLIVRWTDGEVTNYPGVSSAGFAGEYTYVRAGDSTWQHATVIAGGALAANHGANDLIVRWSDGEVTLYPAVDAAGTHAEVKLVNPKPPAYQLNFPATPAAP